MAEDQEAVMDRNIISQRRQAAAKVKSDNEAMRAHAAPHGRGAPGMACEACGGDINPVEGAMGSFPIHMDCVRARAKAAQDGRCHCGPKKRPGQMITTGGYTVGEEHRGGRSRIPCQRCLGTIKQVR